MSITWGVDNPKAASSIRKKGMRPKCDTSTDETLKIGKCQINFVALRHEDPLVFDLVPFSQTTVKQPPSSYTAIRTMHGLVFGCPTHYTRGI